MNVSVSINLMEGDEWTLTPNEAADAILKALGGDEKKDMVSVNVSGSGTAGSTGLPPTPMAAGSIPSPVPPSE